MTSSSGGDDQADHNEAMTAEMTVQTSGLSAEVARGGPHVNLIPREGGNTFSGTTYFGYTNGSWQSDNLGRAARARPDAARLGGRASTMRTSRLGARSSATSSGSSDRSATPATTTSSPTASIPTAAPASTTSVVTNYTARLTWQLNPRNKITGYMDSCEDKRLGHEFTSGIDVATASWSAGCRYQRYTRAVKWTSTVSNNLLLEAGVLRWCE